MNYYVYKLIDLTTKEYYFGSRGTTKLPNDDYYMGSMSVWKPNINNLTKIIIKSNFQTREDAYKYEADLIREKINDKLNMNFHIPNEKYHVEGLVTVKDENGNTLSVPKDDIRYISGELSPINKGKKVVKDLNGNYLQIDKNITDDKYKHTTYGLIPVIQKINGHRLMITKSEYKTNKDLYLSYNHNKISVKDKDGNYLQVRSDDPRYTSGELVGVRKGIPAPNKGIPMSEEQKEKLRKPKSEEHIKKLSESNKNKGNKAILCITTNKRYKSIKDAADDLGLSASNITIHLKGKQKKVKRYKFKLI